MGIIILMAFVEETEAIRALCSLEVVKEGEFGKHGFLSPAVRSSINVGG